MNQELEKKISELIESYKTLKAASGKVKDWKMSDYYSGAISALSNLQREIKIQEEKQIK